MENYNFTQNQIQEHLKGMSDVKDVIYKIISGSYEHLDTINSEPLTTIMNRQINHLIFILNTIQDINNSGADLSIFEIAITDGKNWIENNQ
jgi:hypothetical protein